MNMLKKCHELRHRFIRWLARDHIAQERRLAESEKAEVARLGKLCGHYYETLRNIAYLPLNTEAGEMAYRCLREVYAIPIMERKRIVSGVTLQTFLAAERAGALGGAVTPPPSVSPRPPPATPSATP